MNNTQRKSLQVRLQPQTRELLERIANERRWKLTTAMDEAVKEYAAKQNRRKATA